MKTFLIRFAQIREDFRLVELRAICEYFHIRFPEIDVQYYSLDVPYWIAHFDNNTDVLKILSRAILIKEIVELWACGSTTEELISQVQQLSKEWYIPFQDSAFRFEVEEYERKIPLSEQVQLINRFSFMPLNGPVSMTYPDVRFSLHLGPKKCYFGVKIGEGRRDLIDRFNLKKRHYLGTTSMDAELSLLMCNMAGIGPGTLVYDPFVGTGSFLCVASFFGAWALGSDIDGRQMRGGTRAITAREKGYSMRSNLQQYGVGSRFMDGLVFDFRHHPWRSSITFDAIITDPPYGVRAGAKKIGTYSPYPIPSSAFMSAFEKSDRYPKTIPYEFGELAQDLHRFAAYFLRSGGKLVYWYPAEPNEQGQRPSREDIMAIIPSIPGLQLKSITRQRCRLFDRWLLVLEKI